MPSRRRAAAELAPPAADASSGGSEEGSSDDEEERLVREELAHRRREIEAHAEAIRALTQRCEELARRLDGLCPAYVPTSPSYAPS